MSEFLYNVEILCKKVQEVVNNNDWPTEEGQDRENKSSYITQLVNSILEELE